MEKKVIHEAEVDSLSNLTTRMDTNVVDAYPIYFERSTRLKSPDEKTWMEAQMDFVEKER